MVSEPHGSLYADWLTGKIPAHYTGVKTEAITATERATKEADPHGHNPHAPGAKLDKGKPKVATYVLRYFPRALECVARVSEMGARKYTPGGWQYVTEGAQRYEDAEVRHITGAAKHGDKDPESELPHYCHKAWDALASAELALREEEKAHE